MPRSRKPRTDSVTAQVEAARAAAAPPIEPPEHMPVTSEVMPFFRSVIDAKAPELWAPLDIESAVTLAYLRHEIATLQAKGHCVEKQTRLSLAVARALQIHAEARCGRTAEQRGANQAARKAKAIFGPDDDPHRLLARPPGDDDDLDNDLDELLEGREHFERKERMQ